jgi:hypothetical protein
MLSIRKEQEETLKNAAMERFVTDMVDYVKKHFAEKAGTMDEKELKDYILTSISMAKKYCLESEVDFRKFIHITMLYGLDYDTNKELEWMIEILSDNTETNPSERLDTLYKEVLKRQENK